MIDEYDGIERTGRFRIFMFGESVKGVGSVVVMAKSGDWFVEALNGGLGIGMAGIKLRQTQAQGMFEMQGKIPVAANLEVLYENLALDLAQKLAIRCTNDRVCDRPSIADVCTLLAFVADQPALQNKLSLQSKNVLSRMKKVLSKALKKGRSSEGKVQKLSKTLDEELHAELEELLNGTLNEEKADALRALAPK
ncbi:hypothetical protein AKJ16_DCAP22585 [Drosera capensis]